MAFKESHSFNDKLVLMRVTIQGLGRVIYILPYFANLSCCSKFLTYYNCAVFPCFLFYLEHFCSFSLFAFFVLLFFFFFMIGECDYVATAWLQSVADLGGGGWGDASPPTILNITCICTMLNIWKKSNQWTLDKPCDCDIISKAIGGGGGGGGGSGGGKSYFYSELFT